MSAYDTYGLWMRTAADRGDYIDVRTIPLKAFMNPNINMEEFEQLYEMSEQLCCQAGAGEVR